jgi:hypothetical protein
MTLQELLADPPKLHAFTPVPGSNEEKMFAPGELINRWKLSDEELIFIADHVDEKSKTIETGAGCSTVVFALKGTNHTCIVPDRPLADRIIAFCEKNKISTSRLNFIIQPSEKALPLIEERDFDLALIDGRHGFPQPFMDWYYVAELLKIGGYVIIDDLHVWVCETLVNFLVEEKKDWILAHESLGGAAFKKLGNGTQNNEFPNQLYVRRNSRDYSFKGKIRYMASLLKRGNYKLFASTFKLGVQSALMGKFGERPKGRR